MNLRVLMFWEPLFAQCVIVTRFHTVKIDYFFVDVISPNKTAVSETQTIHILYSQIS